LTDQVFLQSVAPFVNNKLTFFFI